MMNGISMRGKVCRLFFCYSIVLHTGLVHGILFDKCTQCGFWRWQLSSRHSNNNSCDCVFFFMVLFGYRCMDCTEQPIIVPTTLTPSPNLPTSPAASPIDTITPTALTSGLMTMWTSNPTEIKGSSCEYAQSVSTAQGSSWLEPYVVPTHYCAVNDVLYQNGLGCGSCFKISYNGVGGTDPGLAGGNSAIVQVVDSGSDKEFDCFLDVFTIITGSSTGIFPITYTSVPCTTSISTEATPSPTVVILDGDNAWYVKVLIAGGRTSVQALQLTLGTTTYPMERVSGATWKAQLEGLTNLPISFDVMLADKSTHIIQGCFQGLWPVPTSSQCS